jgi:hypothetical protein
MNVYQTKYGNLGAEHTMRPQFVIKNNSVFPTIYNKSAQAGREIPWFEIKGSHVYKTAFHPEGHSEHPVFEMRGTEFHNTVHHPEGIRPTASYYLRHT